MKISDDVLKGLVNIQPASLCGEIVTLSTHRAITYSDVLRKVCLGATGDVLVLIMAIVFYRNDVDAH